MGYVWGRLFEKILQGRLIKPMRYSVRFELSLLFINNAANALNLAFLVFAFWFMTSEEFGKFGLANNYLTYFGIYSSIFIFACSSSMVKFDGLVYPKLMRACLWYSRYSIFIFVFFVVIDLFFSEPYFLWAVSIFTIITIAYWISIFIYFDKQMLIGLGTFGFSILKVLAIFFLWVVESLDYRYAFNFLVFCQIILMKFYASRLDYRDVYFSKGDQVVPYCFFILFGSYMFFGLVDAIYFSFMPLSDYSQEEFVLGSFFGKAIGIVMFGIQYPAFRSMIGARSQRERDKEFWKYFRYLGLLGGTLCLIVGLLDELALSILFGVNDSRVFWLSDLFLGVSFLFSFGWLFLFYLISLHARYLVGLSTFFVIMGSVPLIFANHNVERFIWMLLACTGVLVTFLGVVVWYFSRSSSLRVYRDKG